MSFKMVYSPEFSSGKRVKLTAQEVIEREELKRISEAEVKDQQEKLDKKIKDKASGNQKLRDLGLTDDEIMALTE